MEEKRKEVLESYYDTICINDIKVSVGCVAGEVFIGWYNKNKQLQFIEDMNIFRLKDKVMKTFELEENISMETDLVMNFLSKVLHLNFMSDLRLEIQKDKINDIFNNSINNERDKKIKRKIQNYINKDSV